MLSFWFCPRLRDLPDRKLACIEPATAYSDLASIMDRRVKIDVIHAGTGPDRAHPVHAGLAACPYVAAQLGRHPAGLLTPAAQLPYQRLRCAAKERLPGDIAASWRHVGGRPVLHPRVERQLELHAARIVGKKLPQGGAGHDELPVGKSVRG